MFVNGCDCSIAFETFQSRFDVPYVSETIRENILFLQEEAAIEGDSNSRGMIKSNGITGCVVSLLTLNTAPLLLFLVLGSFENPVFVSGTRNIFQFGLKLVSFEESKRFEVIQNRKVFLSDEKRLFDDCRVKYFELRIERGQSIKLRLDMSSENRPRAYPYDEHILREQGECFHSDCVVYLIDEKELKNIYGVTIQCKKENGTKTEVWIKRVLEIGKAIPEHIEELMITARLFRDSYEFGRFGIVRIRLKNLVLISDETNIESPDAVMGLLRYAVNGSVSADVFAIGGNAL
jgi:hypothetical protein